MLVVLNIHLTIQLGYGSILNGAVVSEDKFEDLIELVQLKSLISVVTQNHLISFNNLGLK